MLFSEGPVCPQVLSSGFQLQLSAQCSTSQSHDNHYSMILSYLKSKITKH